MNRLKSELLKNRLYYLLVGVLLVICLTLRLWRIDQLLGFYYDQGRDALAISDMLRGHLTLIGPTTGITGLFLGPFYYYLLLPGYILGNPVFASYWQSLFIVVGLGLTFYLSLKFFSKIAALISLFLMTFSFYQIKDDRWLSNPAPVTFISPLTLLCLTLSFKKPLPFLPVAAFLLGLMLQLEASSSFFLILITTLMVIIFRKRYTFKSCLFSLISFGATLIPQVLFDLRHGFLEVKLLLQFLHGNANGDSHATFQIPNWLTLQDRLDFYADTFFNKLQINFNHNFDFLFVIFLIAFIFWVIKNWSKDFVKVCAFWFLGVMLALLFYQGNFGRVYGYYLTALVPIFFIFCGVLLGGLWKRLAGKALVVVLLGLFLFDQWPLSSGYLQSGVDGPTTIALGNQVQAVEYILADVGDSKFNTDYYVPPVIPYTYEYLMDYYGKREQKAPNSNLVSNLYTLHEADTERPQRELDWLKRQDGIGQVVKSVRFGGIGVEKRQRIKY